MQNIITFLRDLSEHNDRAWFAQNKNRYESALSSFYAIVDKLILAISQFDSTISNLTAKDCTYRIYRDTRFSKDKSPYKTHMGAYICQGGKKSGYSGYYFHIGTGLGTGYPHAHMLASGDYICEPDVLKTLREDICYGDGDFQDIVTHQIAPEFRLDDERLLHRVPAGFPSDSPYSHYLRLRNFCVYYEPDTDFMLSENVVAHSAQLFRTTLPLLQYINRAVAYCKEEAAMGSK